MAKAFSDIRDLLDEELSAVAFVQDYVEFHFSGPILRSISNPSILCDGIEFRFPEAGSRDALCKAIGSTIRKITLVDDKLFRFVTSNGCDVRIPLDELSRRSGEAMHFIAGPNQPLQVW